MGRCCVSRDARFMPVSPKLLRTNSLRLLRASLSFWRITAQKRIGRESCCAMGKAGLRSLERSALVEAIAQLTRALDQIASLPTNVQVRRDQIRLQVAL